MDDPATGWVPRAAAIVLAGHPWARLFPA